jgi:hypothetical protein
MHKTGSFDFASVFALLFQPYGICGYSIELNVLPNPEMKIMTSFIIIF